MTLVVVLSAALAAGVVLAGAGWYLFGQSEPTPWNKPATVDGACQMPEYESRSECGSHKSTVESPAS